MHYIEYKNTYSSWDEALPFGNGHYGGMCYLDPDDGFTCVINHYDVYYRKLYPEPGVDPCFDKTPWGDYTLEILKQRALDAHADPSHPAHRNYNAVINPSMVSAYGTVRTGASLMVAGRLSIVPDGDILSLNRSVTRLDIEKAFVEYKAESDSSSVNIRSFITPDQDLLVTKISTAGSAGIKTIKLSVPVFRNVKVYPNPVCKSQTEFFVENSFYCSDREEPQNLFHYVWMLKLVGATGRLVQQGENGLEIELENADREFALIATVVSQQETDAWLKTALTRTTDSASRIVALENMHREHWEAFWKKSAIELPDKMLETLWYLHIYALACCSGEGSRLFEQACGLNGLWDIKPPSQWGSSWYWDVNIEQAFWPVFTSNHLELSKPFHKGLLAYEASARKWAKDFYGIDGIASDYPFDVYLCIWAWCAQYFWLYYAYSRDTDFLRVKAYPLMKGVLDFWTAYLQEDPETGKLMIFPDVSPEQGPMTRNSTVSLACVKYLLKAGIEANMILGESADDLKLWQDTLNRMPEYATGDSLFYGKHLKDSDWALTDEYLAHSSILMPIYPIGEINRKCSPDIREIGLNTLRYADKMQAIGTHNLGWPAAAAARLGDGDEALRLLYERGIDFQMRSNGMLAEETERWIQSCLVACVPVYNPPLVEAGSSIAAAINEMLLQSYDGFIDVFPAIPTGNSRTSESTSHFDKLLDSSKARFPRWNDCAFHGLLAEGAFEVSAKLADGKLEYVSIKSLAGSALKVNNRFGADVCVYCGNEKIAFELIDDTICFTTEPGKEYMISPEQKCRKQTVRDNAGSPQMPLITSAATGRRVFLGKDGNTGFIRAIDNAVLDYYPGDKPESRVTLYKFDFTADNTDKRYEDILPKQYHNCGKQGLAFTPVGADRIYHYTAGYGWSADRGQTLVRHDGMDAIRQDAVVGNENAEFLLELNRGNYRLSIIAGDSSGQTYTSVKGPNGVYVESGVLLAGRYAALEVPFCIDKEQVVSLEFATRPGMRWPVCAMFVNRFP